MELERYGLSETKLEEIFLSTENLGHTWSLSEIPIVGFYRQLASLPEKVAFVSLSNKDRDWEVLCIY